ncbi:PAP/OAS1 substrate-binding domain-containing protein [Ascodesmis nigricans]|uniref:polynucleotide adenylyltransferase n=1 Tax=Ascodesmis nigricans TaxID=341454 RepID=A0A4S2MKF5_9PEZI|nr:PAP/OAS1 substrate-binding domain-containing protein [Ascodesmis nigricans]
MNPPQQTTGLEDHLRSLIINNQTPPNHSISPAAKIPHKHHPRTSTDSRGFVRSQTIHRPGPAASQPPSNGPNRRFPGEAQRPDHRPPHLRGPSQNRNYWHGAPPPPRQVVPQGLSPPAATNLHHFPPLGAKVAPPPPSLPSYHSVPTAPCHRPENQRPVYQNDNRDSYHYKQRGLYDGYLAEQWRELDKMAKEVLLTATPVDGEKEAKEKFMQDLEAVCQKVEPTAKLIPFGSIVTGFATRGSDIDCVFTSNTDSALQNDKITEPETPFDRHDELVTQLQESGYNAQLLTRTRVPIIKLVRPATPDVPDSVSCDIGFNNFLAIHNTRLLRTYAACDERLVQMVLFIKWWAKRRHINSPYRGTLSSYGYALLIVHYLINIAQPPVLPNLQLFHPPATQTSTELQYEHNGNVCNIWYLKDTSTLPRSANKASIGELLRGFFEYYAFTFRWQNDVVSIRTAGGILTKMEKNWCAARSRPGGREEGQVWEVKDRVDVQHRYLLAIEDPFETTHNVARTCTFNGVGRIKSELKRAMYLIKSRDPGHHRLRTELFEEAPPERPFVRNGKEVVDKLEKVEIVEERAGVAVEIVEERAGVAVEIVEERAGVALEVVEERAGAAVEVDV